MYSKKFANVGHQLDLFIAFLVATFGMRAIKILLFNTVLKPLLWLQQRQGRIIVDYYVTPVGEPMDSSLDLQFTDVQQCGEDFLGQDVYAHIRDTEYRLKFRITLPALLACNDTFSIIKNDISLRFANKRPIRQVEHVSWGSDPQPIRYEMVQEVVKSYCCIDDPKILDAIKRQTFTMNLVDKKKVV